MPEAAVVSELDSIKGVGEKTRTALLSHFRSVKRLRAASLDEVAAIVGPAKAKVILNALNNKEIKSDENSDSARD